ncbi:MAG: S4 domain-containing protein, partial [Gammaproteobacteria bacterium]
SRQLVAHKAILVNDKVVNVPSFLVNPGDTVSVRQQAKKQGRIQAALALSEQRAPCDWITVDTSAFKGTFSTAPTLTDLSSDYNVNLVVELYSK